MGRVETFTVQNETMIAGERVPVTRYDTAHGTPHQDILDRRGNIRTKRWLHGLTPAEALAEGGADIRANWRRYLAAF